ncbi:MAG TPA: hypothetical protein VGL46_15010 [Pseudonocardiaceae bacterium]
MHSRGVGAVEADQVGAGRTRLEDIAGRWTPAGRLHRETGAADELPAGDLGPGSGAAAHRSPGASVP